MYITNKISHWGDRHHPKILDIIRMLLGLFLIGKGYIFLNNSGYLRYLIIENRAIQQSPEIISALIDYVTYIHLVGGFLIFLGLFTRLWALLNLPIVFGAVFFVKTIFDVVVDQGVRCTCCHVRIRTLVAYLHDVSASHPCHYQCLFKLFRVLIPRDSGINWLFLPNGRIECRIFYRFQPLY